MLVKIEGPTIIIILSKLGMPNWDISSKVDKYRKDKVLCRINASYNSISWITTNVLLSFGHIHRVVVSKNSAFMLRVITIAHYCH